jgi:hypothetical protein
LGEDDDEDEEMAVDNEHAVFVTDDEMARMAAQTVMELVSSTIIFPHAKRI